jgi:catechol 2,3-dioxygenase
MASVIPSDMRLGSVALTVADLDRAVAFYTLPIGLRLIERGDGRAVLGVDGRALVELVADSRAGRDESVAGLYHLAILVPTRAALGRALLRLERHGVRLTGAADHRVSEAVYLDDPEGNGIEIYRDRDRSGWRQDGRITMANTPLDLEGIRAEGEGAGREEAMPAGTVLGHVHLETHDLPATRDFYVGRLGFDLTVDWRQALFMSVGGYHHHLGANIWGGRSRPRQRGERLLGLRHYTMLLEDADAVRKAGDALAAPCEADASLLLTDPSGLEIRVAA